MNAEAWLEGQISVEAALQSGSRVVKTIYVRQGKWDSGVRRLLQLADAAGVPVEQVGAEFVAARTTGSSHGGILAQVGVRRFLSLEALLNGAAAPLIVMLDGIEDPFNFGQALRVLYAAGAQGAVVRPRNWLSAAAVVARASAGASERLPMAMAETPHAAATFYRQRGLSVACTARNATTALFEADMTGPLFLLVGGERRGITRSFLERADMVLSIPYGRSFNQSLGVTASTAVLAFEILRQRGGWG